MKLLSVKIKNFRCYKEEITISLSQLTALIAKNDTGKSSILDALDCFFNKDKLLFGLWDHSSFPLFVWFKDLNF